MTTLTPEIYSTPVQMKTSEDEYNYTEIDYDNFLSCKYETHGAAFLPAVYSVLFVVGVIGNALVLWVLLLHVKLKSMTDVCLLNLAIADLLFVFSLPFLAHYARDQWVFGDPMCRIILGSYNIGFYSGIFFITLMSVDRYLAIVHAVYALKARTATHGRIASVGIWIAGFLSSFPEIIKNKVTIDGNKSICNPLYVDDSEFFMAFRVFKMNILGLVLPLGIMVFCYSMIVRRLLTSKSPKKHAIRLVFMVVMVFFVCWTPYNIACFFRGLEILEVYSFCETSKSIHLSLQITEAIAYLHSCLNPFIYVFVGQKFKKHISRLITSLPCVNCRILKTHLNSATGSVYSQYSLSTSIAEQSTGI
uniref:C-C chemokine receptor type 4-like n=1 Tax=Lepisosteus oculatus TaxID=7918 RepID=W5LXS3_LEPOC|nr:PREDICTED: C-C chemokine receptor type 4-like isoform X2 [Lepisosteus oculatus]XP_015212416.1 PREDICTED: C-C chemokine receptor type 4-like isoform X2 [Lepisosteus oculatus]XP_015212417.1 PREDICTED: C-C chemokine receptor type 4-like isoform X2 [Lepisosteus oculatus]